MTYLLIIAFIWIVCLTFVVSFKSLEYLINKYKLDDLWMLFVLPIVMSVIVYCFNYMEEIT